MLTTVNNKTTNMLALACLPTAALELLLDPELELELDAAAALEPVPVANDVQFANVEDDSLFSSSTSFIFLFRYRIATGYSKSGSRSNLLANLALIAELSGRKAGVSGSHVSVRSGNSPVSK